MYIENHLWKKVHIRTCRQTHVEKYTHVNALKIGGQMPKKKFMQAEAYQTNIPVLVDRYM